MLSKHSGDRLHLQIKSFGGLRISFYGVKTKTGETVCRHFVLAAAHMISILAITILKT